MTEQTSQPLAQRFVYAQDSEPQTERDGVLYVDTSVSPRKTYVYSDDSGSWERINKTPPFTDEDMAETFAESDVTVSSAGDVTKAGVTNGSIGLISVESTVSMSLSNSSSTTDRQGVVINPNSDLKQITVSVETTGATTLYLEASDGTVLETKSISGSGTWDLTHDLTADTDYRVTVDAGGDSFDNSYGSKSFPLESETVDIVGGADNNNSTNSGWAWNVTSITGVTKTPTSGAAFIEWPHPPDVFGWDVAQFQETPDGETVDMYVEVNDGSGWTEAAGPISRGYDLSQVAGPEDNVRFRVNLSRASTANNPTLDAAYRRWEV